MAMFAFNLKSKIQRIAKSFGAELTAYPQKPPSDISASDRDIFEAIAKYTARMMIKY